MKPVDSHDSITMKRIRARTYARNDGIKDTILIGHRLPDTDCVVSAIAYGYLLSRIASAREHFIPAAAGPLNQTTKFVLSKYGVEEPEIIADITPRAIQLAKPCPVQIKDTTSVAVALEVFDRYNVTVLPVVDANNQCVGLLSLTTLLSAFFRPRTESELRRICVAPDTLRKTVKGKYLFRRPGAALKHLKPYVLNTPIMSYSEFKNNIAPLDDGFWSSAIFIVGFYPALISLISRHSGAILIISTADQSNITFGHAAQCARGPARGHEVETEDSSDGSISDGEGAGAGADGDPGRAAGGVPSSDSHFLPDCASTTDLSLLATVELDAILTEVPIAGHPSWTSRAHGAHSAHGAHGAHPVDAAQDACAAAAAQTALRAAAGVPDSATDPAMAADTVAAAVTIASPKPHTDDDSAVDLVPQDCSDAIAVHRGSVGPDTNPLMMSREYLCDAESMDDQPRLSRLGSFCNEHSCPIFSPSLLSDIRSSAATIIISHLDVSSLTLLANQSIPITQFINCSPGLIIPETASLTDLKTKLQADPTVGTALVVDHERRVTGIVSQSDILTCEIADIVMVDHNGPGQAVPGLHSDGLQIVEVIDHHRLENTSTKTAIRFTTRPVCSTSTIVALLFIEHCVDVPPDLAGALLSGILSNSSALKSVGVTREDVVACRHLARIVLAHQAVQQAARSDHSVLAPSRSSPSFAAPVRDPSSITDHAVEEYIAALGKDIFAQATALINDTGNEHILREDMKVYEIDGTPHRFSVSQYEISGLDLISPEMLGQLRRDLRAIALSDHLFMAGVLITDINANDSILVVHGPEELAEIVNYAQYAHTPMTFDLRGIVSRKKQLVPYLMSVMDQLNFE